MPNNKLLSNFAISSHTVEWWPSVVFVRKSLRTVCTGHPAIIPKYGPRLVRIWYITNGCCLYNTCTASEVIIAGKVLLENFLEVHEFTKLLEVYELLKNIPAWQNEIKKQNQKKASGSFYLHCLVVHRMLWVFTITILNLPSVHEIVLLNECTAFWIPFVSALPR